MQSITTKFLPWTDTKPGRIKATATGGHSLTVSEASLPDDMEIDAKHAEVARRLAERLKWRGKWHGGGTIDGTGNHYCCDPAFTIV